MSTEQTPSAEDHYHRKMAAWFFNETWSLLDKKDRTPEEDALMIHLAHASRLHWGFVGTVKNVAIGEWQISRVHAVLRQPESALYHAQQSLDIAKHNGLGPFHVGYGHEAMARALAITNFEAAAEHVALARKFAQDITDPKDKKLLEDDLAAIERPA